MLDVTEQPVIQPVATLGRHKHHQCGSRSAHWFCVRTHPQAERWALANLTRQGFETYLPLLAVQRQDRVVATLKHTVLVPLFSTYLFVRFDPHEPWQAISSTYGVRKLLGEADGNPLPVRGGAVERLQASETQRAMVAPETTRWAPGMACSVSHGAFNAAPAVVLAVNDGMAYVSMLMLGHLREVSVSLDCLRARDAD
jgi:transcription antitermination factor NusG